MRIWILLPAYNEEQALEPLVRKTEGVLRELGLPYAFVVVDDGSSDGTADALRRLASETPMHVLTHPYNRGLGETIRDGIEYVVERGNDGDVLVRMDCDYTHEPKYIEPMLAKLNEGHEVVIASRYAPGGGQHGVNLYRRTISRAANLIIKMFFPIRGAKEYSCGFRAFRVSFLKDAVEIFGNRFIDLKGMGFTGTVEKLIKAKMMGAAVAEVPFVLRYDMKLGHSKMVSSITTLGYLALIAKYVVPWGPIGQEWQRKIAERQRRIAAEGLPGLELQRAREEAG